LTVLHYITGVSAFGVAVANKKKKNWWKRPRNRLPPRWQPVREDFGFYNLMLMWI